MTKTSDERLADIIEILTAIVRAGDCRLRSADDRVPLPFKADTLLSTLTELQALRATPAPEPQPEVAGVCAWPNCTCSDLVLCPGVVKPGSLRQRLSRVVKALVTPPQPEAAAEPVAGSQTTPAMRERLRELTKTDGRDDYDRCVLALLDDYEAQIKANAANLERYIPEYFSGTYSGMAKHPLGPWIRYDDPALTALRSPSVVEEAVKAEREALRQIEAEAKFANNVIAHNRDGQGQGRVKVATSMHRIEKMASVALARSATP